MSEEALDLPMMEMMILRKETKVSRLMKEVPRPGGDCVVGGLPSWREAPLGVKLPMIPAPKGAILFTRGTIGSKLWKGSSDAEFRLSDPYARDIQFSYESLHDGHLRGWFDNPRNLAPLLRNGLVTRDRLVKCSLKQYNEYRKYLNRLHTDSAAKEQLRREARALEERLLRDLQDNAWKDNLRQIQREKMKEKFDRAMEAQKELQREAEERLQSKKLRAARMAKQLKKKASEESTLRKMKSRLQDLKIQRNVAASLEIQRQKRIVTLRRWAANEKERKAQMDKRIKEKAEARKKKEADRWNEKIRLQEYQIAKEKEMFLLYNRFMEKKTNLREKAVEKAREKFNKGFEKAKGTWLREVGRKKDFEMSSPSIKSFKFSQMSSGTLEKLAMESKSEEHVDSSTIKALTRSKPVHDVQNVIMNIGHRVIFEFVKQKVISEIKVLLIRANQEFRHTSSDEVLSEGSSFKTLNDIETEIRDNRFATKSSKSILKFDFTRMEDDKSRSVRFGDIECIPFPINSDLTELKKSRERPPTPIPSSVDLMNLQDIEEPAQSLKGKAEIERRIAGVVGKLRKLMKWRVKKLSQPAFTSDTPIIDAIAARKRDKERGLDVPRGLTMLILSVPLEGITSKRLCPYLDALAQHLVDPQGYPLPFVDEQLD